MNPINRVWIVGGTHGNELTGIYLIQKFGRQPALIRRSNFTTHTLVGNPKAIARRQRYIDTDLNRSFERRWLTGPTATGYEAERAREICRLIEGDRPADSAAPVNADPGVDVIIDLHSTTANMGLTLIVDSEDDFNLQCAAYLHRRHPTLRIYNSAHSGRKHDSVRSLGQFGIGIEVGPVAQGVLNADFFHATEALIYSALDFCQDYNVSQAYGAIAPAALSPLPLTFYRYVGTLDYPRSAHGDLTAMIHPSRQFQDYAPLHPGDPIFQTFDGEAIAYTGPTTVYPIFINEAAYYEKGIAMTLTEQQVIEF